MSEFTVEISRPGELGALTSATLELPATQAEYHDAMEQARITDNRVIYSVELCDVKRDCLRPHIRDNMRLLELNLLAIRMDKHIKGNLDIFGAMVKIEAGRNGGKPIPLPRLINMTFSIDNCHVTGNVASDTQLGKFLYENEFLSDEDAGAVQARSEAGRDVSDLFALLGQEHRKNEGGVFTNTARYVEYDGSIDEAYVPGEMAYFDCSHAPVVLEISKGHFNDPDYDNDLTVSLELPLQGAKQLSDALEKVEAASTKEIGYHCTDCLIPSAKELIDNAEDIEAVGRFAEALVGMQKHTYPVVYKAILETIDPPDLESATRLVADADQYALDAETSGPEDYAREYLSRLKGGDDRIDLSKMINLYALGGQVMELENAEWTSYGVLKRKDGGPIQAQEQGAAPGVKMEGP